MVFKVQVNQKEFKIPFTYSFNIDATSLNPTNTLNGTGSMGYTIETFPDWEMLLDETIIGTLDDLDFTGMVTQVAETDERTVAVNVTPYFLSFLNSDASIAPHNGTVSTFVWDLFDSLGIPAQARFVILPDSSIADVPVVAQGFVGNVWAYFRDFLQAYRYDIVQDGFAVRIVPISNAKNVIKRHQTSASGKTVSYSNLARTVEVTNYNNKWVTNGQVYPVTGDTPSVITVQAGEVAEIELNLKTSLKSVGQPTPVDNLSPNFNPQGTSGRYTISGSDGLPVAAANWTAGGGKVEVSIKPGTFDTVIVRVVAPTQYSLKSPDGIDRQSPYSLAVASGDGSGNAYPTLYLTGVGTQWNDEIVSFNTGAPQFVPASEVGETLTNTFVNNLSMSYDLGVRLAQAYCGPDYSQNRNLTSSTTARIAGGLFDDQEAIFRITESSYATEGISFGATMNTTFAHFDEVWAGKTFADFDASWAGRTLKDFSLKPLRKVV